MPAQSSAAGAPPPPVPPRHGPPRDVDGLIRELQRINLSQCMDQLTADIQQLSSMERQLGQWRGLYVRCPGPEPDDLATEPGDKKSSSGYSTESGSPPASRNTSGEGIDGHGGDGYGTDGRIDGSYGMEGRPFGTEGRADGQCGTDGRSDEPYGMAGQSYDTEGRTEFGCRVNGLSVNNHMTDVLPANRYTPALHAVNGCKVNNGAMNDNGVNGHRDNSDGTGSFGRGRATVGSFKPLGGAAAGGGVGAQRGGENVGETRGWRGVQTAGEGFGLRSASFERETRAVQPPVAAVAPLRDSGGLVSGFRHRDGLSGHIGLSNGPSGGVSTGSSGDVCGGGGGDLSAVKDGFTADVATSADQALGGQRDPDPRQRSVPRWRRQAGPDSPVGPRRVGLLQSSVAHSSQSRPVTPLLSRAPFCPPAASTPTLSPKVPRSPKTLRFAASHELIPPDSPSRRQVSGGAPPRPGILRSRASSVERPEALSRPAPPGWRAGSSSSSPSPGRGRRAGDSAQEATDSAERFSRVVSALSRLEAELSGVQRRPPPARAACGTAQFVRLPPRRQLSFTALPPPPRHPPLLTGSATDSDDSDSEFESDSRWLVGAASAARPPPAPPSEDDFEVSRGARLPPPYPAQPPRRRRPSLSWLLSCGSRRRPPSPPSTLLPAPPREPPVTSAGAAYGCNLCKARFAEHFQLVSHVHERHVRVQMRPKYSCGLCPARFYASKFLARHCAYNHNSMGDARTPQCLKAESAT
ncbi:uncharacterized protein LOC122384972 [Amphibalanus amphitrite]|uniref:uncharacterized protein LOC122384972 n=1 Tax=Amphibalanus amphitrite TaxID=1232801 RepID=UPI001C916431|nr:uncharacterized protein LOC122384972 [Amphibalanus amphitrite]